MPDSKGNLNTEEQEKAEQWLNKTWKNWACHSCGKGHWEVGDFLVQAMPYVGGRLVVGGTIYPLLIVTCVGCGNTMFINAIIAGIVAQQEAPS